MDKFDHEELIDIRNDMIDLLSRAKNLLRMNASSSVYERAKAYWIGHLDTALGGGKYMDTYDYTMLKTIEELESEIENKNEGEEDT
jgi:hypothetical protein